MRGILDQKALPRREEKPARKEQEDVSAQQHIPTQEELREAQQRM